MPNRRKFSAWWDEVDYLYFKAGHWIYEREMRGRARPFVKRLKRILAGRNVGSGPIMALEAQCLIADFQKDYKSEIHHKRQLVNVLRRLMRIHTDEPGYGPSGAVSEMEILATLLEEDGQRAKALNVVEECRSFAKQYGVKFHEARLRKLILE